MVRSRMRNGCVYKQERSWSDGAIFLMVLGIVASLLLQKFSCWMEDKEPIVSGRLVSWFHCAENTVRLLSDESTSGGMTVIPVKSRQRYSSCVHLVSARMSWSPLFETLVCRKNVENISCVKVHPQSVTIVRMTNNLRTLSLEEVYAAWMGSQRVLWSWDKDPSPSFFQVVWFSSPLLSQLLLALTLYSPLFK